MVLRYKWGLDSSRMRIIVCDQRCLSQLSCTTFLARIPSLLRGLRVHGRHGKVVGFRDDVMTHRAPRYALAVKGLPFKTEWVEYPDIEPICKKLGAKHTRLKPDGTPNYTLPVIYDPNTKTVVEDSLKIAIYLDQTYPNATRLFPENTFVVQTAFMAIMDPITLALLPVALLPIYNNLNPRGADFFREAREKIFKQPFEDWVPKDEEGRTKPWKEMEEGLAKVARWFAESDNTGPYVMSDTLSYADIDLASRFVWLRVVYGEESEEWGRIRRMDNGRWADHLKLMEKYEVLS